MTERNTPPDVWERAIGNKSDSYYDKWFYHKDDEYEVHVWWDEGNSHCVEILPIKGFDEYDDPVYGHPMETREFDTENEAIEYAHDLMEKCA